MGRKSKKRKFKAQKPEASRPSKNETQAPKKKRQSSVNDIKIELGFAEDDYKADEGSNALVLPSKREKQKKNATEGAKPIPKKLSKKQRKRLEKVVQQKQKKGKVNIFIFSKIIWKNSTS